LGVALLDEAQMAELNVRFRGIRGATDVLSFPSGEPGHLGDVALCIPVARQQARRLGHALRTELSVLLVHALVHLGGLDHQRSREEAIRQAEIEMGMLSTLGVSPAAALTRRGL
jgi:probable rRNA maturation factor